MLIVVVLVIPLPISKIVKYLLITPIIYSKAPNCTLFEIGAPNYRRD
jgi:hypothetical protein